MKASFKASNTSGCNAQHQISCAKFGEPQMKLVTSLLSTLSAALFMASALCADDAVKPKVKATDSELSAAGSSQPDAEASPAAKLSWPSQPAHGAAQAGRAHRFEESGAYTPKLEWFLGYSFWRAMPTSERNRMGYLHGGSTSLAYNFNRYVGLVADFGGYANSRLTLFSPGASQTVDSDGTAYSYLFGPRFSYRRYERITPFFQVLFGGAHATAVTISGCTVDPTCTPLTSENSFAGVAGAGLDIKLSRHVALRLVEGDFLMTHFHDPFSADPDERGWQKNVRLSSGLVFRFGGNPPPPPPVPLTASCSSDKELVYVGSGDVVTVHVQADNSERYPVNYAWSASEGAVDGTGSDVRWNSSERRPGAYSVRVRVENGRHGSADCSVNVRVEPRPNRPPTIRCSSDRSAVTVGDAVTITAISADADNDPLTLSWSSASGKMGGSESSVRFETTNLAPGPYKITGHVDDGRGGTDTCAVDVEVQAVQIPAEVKELETRLALHSVYFPTARPSVAKPAGGLVESQEKVLLSLASDFNRYLTFKPEAHLTLQGHADRRGSEEYNKELTERRVERTKNFLVEHGVPAANIETRALGENDNLTLEQVQQLIAQNPDLTAGERQRIESNIHVVVLANNRRVDVSLSTTGQQSIRQYPFNAKDSLTLLSAAGGASEKHTSSTTKATKP